MRPDHHDEQLDDTTHRRRARIGAFLAGFTAAGLLALVIGLATRDAEPEPAAGEVATAPAEPVDTAAIALSEEPAIEPEPTIEVMEARVASLEAQIEEKQAEIDALRAEAETKEAEDATRAAAARKRWQEKETEVARLQVALSEALADRDELKWELGRTQIALKQEQRRTQVLTETVQRLDEANTDNLWAAFVNNAAVRVCDKGTRKAHERCHEALTDFFGTQARSRFESCVRTQQAMPLLRKGDSRDELPSHAQTLPDDNRFTKKGWFVLWCDPSLPEEGVLATDVTEKQPQRFAASGTNMESVPSTEEMDVASTEVED